MTLETFTLIGMIDRHSLTLEMVINCNKIIKYFECVYNKP